ncbi:MAG: TonB-dependent receptor, partial [Candidatus Eremiobacteraeota bacterium]|nr:TonB-dependent receptor [Candidatus Eremiobacteraeota bacterium]
MSFVFTNFSNIRFGRVFLAFGLITSLLLTNVSSALAAGGTQGNLRGTVISHDTDKPLADTKVFADAGSGSFESTTDAGGHFRFLGLPSDTYTLTFNHVGFEARTIAGNTVLGDQTVDVGAIVMISNIKTIGTVTSRAQNSAFQPSQTTDSTTLSGARITQALGSATSVNEQNLILAAPGAVQDTNGNVSVRGSLSVELGYQFDGVNFSVPFFDANGSNGYLNNLSGGSGGSLQVVSGSGDATQGNIGAGVINVVPGRGVYPGRGLIGIGVGSPAYNHALDFNYAWATPNGRFSNYLAINSIRGVPSYSPFNADASTIGQFNGTSFTQHDDVLDNFFYRFGKNNNQSLQLLYRTANDSTFGDYGGLGQGLPAGTSLYYPYNPLSNSFWVGPLPGGQAQYDSLIHYFPGVPTTAINPVQPEQTGYSPLHFTKLGYNWNISPTTFLSASIANFIQFAGNTNFTNGAAIFPDLQEVGGQRVTYSADLTHVFGENHTVTLATKYEDAFPRWHQEGVNGLLYPLEYLSPAGNPGSPNVSDFFLPADPTAVSSAANPCQAPGGCYIHDALVASGKWTGVMPRVPTAGIDYHSSLFQEWGIGLRDQWQVTPKLKLDFGIRVDGANYQFGKNPFNLDLANPSDVNASTLGNDFLRPRVVQPRFAAAYRLTPNDSVRASYGRSVNFFFAQTAGTPADIQNVDPLLLGLAAKPGAASCGSGYHGPGTNANGTYVQNPLIPSGYNGVPYYFPCANYAQSLAWLYDQTQDAPDVGGQGPPTFSNYDVAYQHLFTKGSLRGFGVKLTGFARRGFNIEENTLVANGPPNPVTGQTSASVFATRANGVEKTAGLEFQMTAPDRPYGWGGFLSMTYTSSFTSSPPTGAAGTNYATDSLPIVNAFLFRSNTLFRSGFQPPFQARLGVEYKTKHGFRINPVVAYNGGFPFGVGSNTYNFVNGQYQFFPQTNFGLAAPIGGVGGPGFPYNASNYVDPAYPGSYLKPNIAATRGFSEPALPGNALTKPSASVDLDLEYDAPKFTLGAYVGNIFNQHYGIPYQNTSYQPVATGVAGPQTGLFT